MNMKNADRQMGDLAISHPVRIGGFVAGTAVLMSNGSVPIERVMPGQWMRTSDNQSGRPTHRQVVAVHRQEGKVWLVALKSVSCALNSVSEPIHSHVAVGFDQAFLTLNGWRRTDELKAGDRILVEAQVGDWLKLRSKRGYPGYILAQDASEKR